MIFKYKHYCFVHNFHNLLFAFKINVFIFLVPFGSYWSHFKSFWPHRNDCNVLVLKYEDMKKDLHKTVTTVSNFLGKPVKKFYMNDLLTHLSFEQMQRNFFCNYECVLGLFRELQCELLNRDNKKKEYAKFMRKGRIGSYKDEMSKEVIKTYNKWIKENVKGTDFENMFINEYCKE